MPKNDNFIYFDEVMNELKKHWFHNADPLLDDEYLTLDRIAVQAIIRKDIIGRYLGLKEGEKAKKKYTGLNNKLMDELLYVFPKYNYHNEEPFVSSIWDELEIAQNSRASYEENPKPGRPGYKMNEAYLFSLKHEVERRQYPTKQIYIPIDGKAQIRDAISNEDTKNNFIKIISATLNNFNMRIQGDLSNHNKARKVESERLDTIINYVNIHLKFLNTNIQVTDSWLKENKKLEILNKRLKKDLDFHFNVEEKIQNLIEIYSNDYSEPHQKKKSVSQQLYDFEKNKIKKYSAIIESDNAFLIYVSLKRKETASILHQSILTIQDPEEREYHLLGLEIIGAR